MTSITVCSRVNTTQNTTQVQAQRNAILFTLHRCVGLQKQCSDRFLAYPLAPGHERNSMGTEPLSVQTLTKQSGLLCCSAQSSTSSVMAKGCGCALLGSAWKISPSSNWACAKPPVTPAIRSQPATRGPRHSNGVTPEKTTDDRCQWRF